MFRYGIKALEVKHGYKSYLAIKQLCKLSINEVKDGVSKGEVLPIWEFSGRDLAKLNVWQAKMQTEMRTLQEAGVTYDSYVYHDELGWQPITQLEPLLQKDTSELQFVMERDKQAAEALKRYQQGDNPTQALDELISLMSDEMREVLYDSGATPSFNTRLHRMLPMLDTAETRMLAYELDSHVRRQSINMGSNSFFSTPAPAPTEAEYQVIETIPEPAVVEAAPTLVTDIESTPVITTSAEPSLTSSPSTPIAAPTSLTAETVVTTEVPDTPWWLLIVIALLLGFVWWLS